MAAQENVSVVQLRRYDTSQPWGFRMQGGSEYQVPLHVAQVSPNSVAGVAGLTCGDVIIGICKTNVQGYSHEQAKAEMIRAGNEVDLTIVKSGMTKQEVQSAQAPSGGRVELSEESIDPHMNEGTKFRNVTPKTYKILNEELDSGNIAKQAQASQAPPSAGGNRPASIFDKKKQERSKYLQASGSTIQKAYGQS